MRNRFPIRIRICFVYATRRHSRLLEVELDVLYSHIGSPPVVAGFPALAQRIANRELPQGADIIVGIHERLLKGRHPSPLTPTPSLPLAPSSGTPLRPPLSFCGPPTQVARDMSDTVENEPEPSDVDKVYDEFELSKQPEESSDTMVDAECPAPEDDVERIRMQKKKGSALKKKKKI